MPFYLRTGKRMAEGARIISIAFREPPQSMFPPGSGVGDNGPDHLTFDLADKSRMSLSFYGKRPGPGFRLDKLSMQFSMQETSGRAPCSRPTSGSSTTRRAVTARCSRRHPASSGCGRSPSRCSRTRPPVRPYAQGTWGPNQIHQLIAPYTWRLPFERQWRDRKF